MKMRPGNNKFGCLEKLFPVGGGEGIDCRKDIVLGTVRVSLTCSLELGEGGGGCSPK